MSSVSAFWGDREVSRSAAAEAISAVLVGIRAVDPLLATWRKQGGSRAQALAQPMIDPGPDAVAATVGLHAQNPNLRNSFVVTLPSSWEERDLRLHSLVEVLVGNLRPDEVVHFGPQDRIV